MGRMNERVLCSEEGRCEWEVGLSCHSAVACGRAVAHAGSSHFLQPEDLWAVGKGPQEGAAGWSRAGIKACDWLLTSFRKWQEW